MTGRASHIFFPNDQFLAVDTLPFSPGQVRTLNRLLCSLVLWILLSVSSYAQRPIFQLHDFSSEIDAQINCLFSDIHGLMWLGTSKGLYRYSGVDYELIANPGSDSSMNITTISAIGDELLIAANGNLFTVSSPGKMSQFMSEDYPITEKITGIEVDKEGAIIVSTYGEGLFIFRHETWTGLAKDDGLLGNDIYDIKFDLLGDLWIATDNGVSILSFVDEKRIISEVTTIDGLNDEIVYALAPDSFGMWLGFHSEGFCHVAFGPKKEIKCKSKNWIGGPIVSLVPDGNNNLWIATERNGVFRAYMERDLAVCADFDKMDQFDFEGASQMVIDQDSRLWVTLLTGKLFSADLKMQRLFSEIHDVQAICEATDSAVYVGTADGLYVLKDGNFDEEVGFSENVLSIYEDLYGRIWIGTFGNGVYVWSPKAGTSIQISEANGLRNGSVFSIDGDSTFIWLATLDGVVEIDLPLHISRYRDLEIKHLDTEDPGTANVFQKVFAGADGSVWFGTSGQGVLVKQGQHLFNIMADSSQYLRTVYCFAADRDGAIWMATDKFGLYIYDNGSVQEYYLNENLRSKSITSLHAHGDKMFCLHEEGVDVIDLRTGALTYLGSRQALGSFAPVLNAISEGSTNTLWIGASNDIYIIPNLSALNLSQPSILLDEIDVWGERINIHVNPQLNSKQNYLSIKYTGLWYHNPMLLSFQYKLDGQDLDWNTTGDRNLTYPNLSAGKYELHVRPMVYGQAISDEEIRFPFEIRKPFYLQVWFLVLTILGLFGIVLKVLGLRQKGAERKFKDDRDRIELKYEVLKAQINPHFLFNSFNTLASFVEEDPKVAVEYIEKLSDYYRTITQYRDHKLITVDKELHIIRDYIFLLKKRFGENLNCVFSVQDRTMRIPPLTLQLLVENAVKHNVVSALMPLDIHIESDGRDHLIVRNTLQLKRGSNASTNFGLSNVMNRVQLASGKAIEIEKTESEFIVRIPLVKSQDQ